MTSVVCLQLFYMSFTCTLIHVIVIQLLAYHVIWLTYVCSLFCYYFMHTVYMHKFSSLHTHSPGRFLTTLDLHVQIWTLCFSYAGIQGDGALREELELLPIRFRYSYLSYVHIIS